MSGFLKTSDLPSIAVGLNYEGYYPYQTLPKNCIWYNIIQIINDPLDDTNKINKYELIEKLNDLINLINKIKKNHKNLLVHQYTNDNIINEILEEKTGVKVICDPINFVTSPINYSLEYPDIDGLLRISSCDRIGSNAETWIIPTGFLDYDTINNLIYTTPKYANNQIEKYLDLEYIAGNILVVNPSNQKMKINDISGVLLLDEKDQKVLEFVITHTKDIFDESHDWRHAVRVAQTATKILNNKYVLYLSLLHDVCDHKYPEAIPRDMLSKYINEELSEYKRIDDMIEQVSFSKQKNHNKVDPILEAVRDGDRLEAIGQIGVTRCIQYAERIGGVVPHDVINHCYAKLLRLVPEQYIVSDVIKKEKIKGHNEIVDYVRKHLSESGLDYIQPDYL
jgi:HD superfamily phosphodiesterase